MRTRHEVCSYLAQTRHNLYTADTVAAIETLPFEVSETGYGEFEIELRLYFDPSAGEKPQYRFHRLRLEPYGDEAQQTKQRNQKLVVAETCEIVEFNEPSQDFFTKLTNEDQFAPLRKKTGGKGRGAGKGRGKNDRIEYEGDKEPSANFPDRSSEQVPWSKDMERKVLDMLADAQRELDISIEQEKKKAQERQRRLTEVG